MAGFVFGKIAVDLDDHVAFDEDPGKEQGAGFAEFIVVIAECGDIFGVIADENPAARCGVDGGNKEMGAGADKWRKPIIILGHGCWVFGFEPGGFEGCNDIIAGGLLGATGEQESARKLFDTIILYVPTVLRGEVNG